MKMSSIQAALQKTLRGAQLGPKPSVRLVRITFGLEKTGRSNFSPVCRVNKTPCREEFNNDRPRMENVQQGYHSIVAAVYNTMLM